MRVYSSRRCHVMADGSGRCLTVSFPHISSCEREDIWSCSINLWWSAERLENKHKTAWVSHDLQQPRISQRTKFPCGNHLHELLNVRGLLLPPIQLSVWFPWRHHITSLLLTLTSVDISLINWGRCFCSFTPCFPHRSWGIKPVQTMCSWNHCHVVFDMKGWKQRRNSQSRCGVQFECGSCFWPTCSKYVLWFLWN